MRTIMESCAKKTNGKFINFSRSLKRFKKSPRKDRKLRNTIANLASLKKDYVFIHHHHGYPGIGDLYDDLQAAKAQLGDNLFLFTIVREPISFLISRINYVKNHMKGDLTIRTAIDNERHHNWMHKYFLYNHPICWDDNEKSFHTNFFMKHFDLMDRVFLTKNIDQIVHMLERHCGPIKDFGLINTSNKTEIPTEDEIEQLKACNQLDYFFYKMAQKQTENYLSDSN